MPSFAIGAELADRFARDDVQSELTYDYDGRLHEFDLAVTATTSGTTVLSLTITAADLWTAILTCMSLFDHGRYDITQIEAQLQV